MLIKTHDYEYIKSEINKVVIKYGINDIIGYYQKLKNGEIKCNEPNVRLMYDLQRKADLSRFVCDVIYVYANDTHYKTALLKAGKELNLIN